MLPSKPARPGRYIATVWFAYALTVIAFAGRVAPLASAAELDGIQMPPTVEIGGKTLRLNGLGLRTYSIFAIHIYVAGLYLEHLSNDAQEILRSPETKLLALYFERNVSAEQARDSWRTGLVNNCQAPCRLDPGDFAKFLADIPAVRAGDTYSFFFQQGGVEVIVDGKRLGKIDSPDFAGAMLAMFLGPKTAEPALREELLEGLK